MEASSQEAMINYRHGIIIGDYFYGITKVKTSMIYKANILKSLILVRKTGQKSIPSQEHVA